MVRTSYLSAGFVLYLSFAARCEVKVEIGEGQSGRVGIFPKQSAPPGPEEMVTRKVYAHDVGIM
jgi:hypothetical protein